MDPDEFARMMGELGGGQAPAAPAPAPAPEAPDPISETRDRAHRRRGRVIEVQDPIDIEGRVPPAPPPEPAGFRVPTQADYARRDIVPGEDPESEGAAQMASASDMGGSVRAALGGLGTTGLDAYDWLRSSMGADRGPSPLSPQREAAMRELAAREAQGHETAAAVGGFLPWLAAPEVPGTGAVAGLAERVLARAGLGRAAPVLGRAAGSAYQGAVINPAIEGLRGQRDPRRLAMASLEGAGIGGGLHLAGEGAVAGIRGLGGMAPDAARARDEQYMAATGINQPQALALETHYPGGMAGAGAQVSRPGPGPNQPAISRFTRGPVRQGVLAQTQAQNVVGPDIGRVYDRMSNRNSFGGGDFSPLPESPPPAAPPAAPASPPAGPRGAPPTSDNVFIDDLLRGARQAPGAPPVVPPPPARPPFSPPRGAPPGPVRGGRTLPGARPSAPATGNRDLDAAFELPIEEALPAFAPRTGGTSPGIQPIRRPRPQALAPFTGSTTPGVGRAFHAPPEPGVIPRPQQLPQTPRLPAGHDTLPGEPEPPWSPPDDATLPGVEPEGMTAPASPARAPLEHPLLREAPNARQTWTDDARGEAAQNWNAVRQFIAERPARHAEDVGSRAALGQTETLPGGPVGRPAPSPDALDRLTRPAPDASRTWWEEGSTPTSADPQLAIGTNPGRVRRAPPRELAPEDIAPGALLPDAGPTRPDIVRGGGSVERRPFDLGGSEPQPARGSPWEQQGNYGRAPGAVDPHGTGRAQPGNGLAQPPEAPSAVAGHHGHRRPVPTRPSPPPAAPHPAPWGAEPAAPTGYREPPPPPAGPDPSRLTGADVRARIMAQFDRDHAAGGRTADFMTAEARANLERILAETAPDERVFTARTLQTLKEDLDEVGAPYTRSADPQYAAPASMYRSAIGALRQMQEDIGRAVLPAEDFANFMGLKRRYGALTAAAEGGQRRAITEAINRPAKVPTIAAASVAAASGAGVARTGAIAGLTQWARGRDHAIYAGAMSVVESALRGAGSLGRYTEPLAQIARRGQPALSAAVFTLMQNDPEFHAQITRAQEQANDPTAFGEGDQPTPAEDWTAFGEQE